MQQFYSFSKLLGAAAVFLTASVNSIAQTTNFTYTGAVQTYTVPAGVTALAIEAAGGKGGDNDNWPSGTYPSQGGNGGHVVCSLAVTGGQVLAINVGGQGMVGTSGVNASGGYNGGGTGGHSGSYSGGGGGGATDISIGGNKVIVAGGGGGAGLDYPGGNKELGGAGGGLIGGNGYFGGSNTNSSGGFGGTQTAGGSNGNGGGAAGSLGAGGDAYLNGASGGGGGGYYGGGGGGSAWAGGGGGSSYTDAVFATGVTHTQAANAGNGYAIITVLNAIPTFVSGATHHIFLCQPATSADVSSALAITDGDNGELETFTMYEAPVNGSLTGFPTTVTATAGPDAPSGIVYAPTSGYVGNDSFKVIVTDEHTGADTITVYVTIYPQPDVTATTDVAYCNAAATTDIFFSGSVSGTTFDWTNDNSTIGLASIGTGDILLFTATNNGTANEMASIVVTPTANGCTGPTDTFTITVYPTPTVAASGDQAVCNTGATTNVTFSGAVSGTTFDWVNDNTTIGLAANGTGDIASFTATNGGSIIEVASIIVTPTANSCAGATDTFSMTVYPTPTVAASGDQTVCNTGTTTDVIFAGTVSGTTFPWENDNTTVGLAAAGTGDILSFAATNSGTTSEVATIIVTPLANGCPGVDDTFTVTVYPTPTVAASGDQTVCNTGSTTNVIFTGAISGTTFDWVNDNSTIGLAANGTGDIMSFTATNSGTVNEIANIVVTPTANSCAGATDTFSMTVYPTPTVAASGDQTVCNTGSTSNVIFSGAVSATSFDWVNDKASIGLASAGSGDIMSFIATNSGTANDTANIIVTPAANGCPGATDTFSIVVYPTPNVDPTADQAFCNTSTTTTVPFTGAVSGTSFNWINDNTTTGLAASGTGDIAPFTATNGSATINEVGSVIVLPVANGCAGTPDTFSVTVYPTPVFTVPSNQTLCNGTATTAVNFTGTPSGVTFSWTNSNTAIGLTATGSGNIASFTATNTSAAPIAATVAVTPAANGCTGAAQAFNFVVNPTPSLSSSLTPPAICDSSMFSYTATSATAGAIIAWFRPVVTGIVTPATGGIGNVDEQLINSTNTNVTVGYTYLLTANGCLDTQTVNVVVRPTPRMSSDSTGTVCSGTLFAYTPASFVPTGVSYAWSRASVTGITPAAGSGTGNVSETLINNTAAPLTATYVYTLDIAGCTHNEQLKVTVNANPGVPEITTMPGSVCDNTYFRNLGASTASSNYSWSAINASIYAIGNTKQYALVNFTEPGTAKVILTNTAAATGCRNSDTATIAVSSSAATEGVYVIYHNGQLICLRNDVDSYTWGYDDALTLDSTVIAGETHANYFISSLATSARNYWVITTKDGCSQKSYYNKPADVENVNAALTANLNVYPNPANDVINVDITTGVKGNVEIDVFNIVGQKVRTAPANGNKATIGIADLSAGMYVVDCYIEGVKVGSSKFIKN